MTSSQDLLKLKQGTYQLTDVHTTQTAQAENRSRSCNTNLHTLKIPGCHFGPCVANPFLLWVSGQSGLTIPRCAVPSQIQSSSSQVSSCHNPNTMGGLHSYPTWGLSLSLCFPLHLYSVTSTRAQVGLNTPSQRIGRGRHKDPEVVISHSI